LFNRPKLQREEGGTRKNVGKENIEVPTRGERGQKQVSVMGEATINMVLVDKISHTGKTGTYGKIRVSGSNQRERFKILWGAQERSTKRGKKLRKKRGLQGLAGIWVRVSGDRREKTTEQVCNWRKAEMWVRQVRRGTPNSKGGGSSRASWVFKGGGERRAERKAAIKS